MELANVTAAPRRPSPASGGTAPRPSLPSSPAELHQLMAAQNAAATITPGADYAIWEDACRRLIEARPASALPAKAAAPRTVLVIAASATLRETMNRALDTAGYEVLLAPDAAKGLAVATERKTDLILTDLDVPAVDGIALIAQLRALSTQQLTPIMMLAAANQDGKKIAARRAGASGWIAKPFDPQRFIEIVQKVCPAL
jgi:two-component system chemotaxis response regulator CheY